MSDLYFGKTFDEVFDSAFKAMTKGVEDHQFRHYNNALGIFVYSKEHYRHEMKKRRMLPTEACEELADEWDKKHPQKAYDEWSPKAREIINAIRHKADKNGNIKLEGRAIDALVEIGAISTTEHRPDSMVGGFGE